MKIALLMATTSLAALTVPFASEPPSNSVQLRVIPPNGGNLQSGPESVPVVTIITDAGPVRINRSDYDPAQHTLADGEEVPATNAPAAPPAPPAPPAPDVPVVAVPPSNTPPDPAAPPTGAPPPPAVSEQTTPPPAPPVPVEKFVTKNGKKWFVTDTAGKPLDTDHPGYDTEAAAQEAAKA